MSTNRPRYTVSVDNELLQVIEDFQFANRYKTRSSATVELIRLGVQWLLEGRPELAQSPAPDDHTLIEAYRALNDEGKEKAREYIADLKGNPRYKKRDEPVMDKQA